MLWCSCCHVNEKWVPNGDSRAVSSALWGTAEFFHQTKCKQGVCHTVAFPFTLKKSILIQKKNYGNSNISPCKNIIFKKSSKRNQNPSRYYNSITILEFQHKPKYHLSKILI
jgi:hypothetical protein